MAFEQNLVCFNTFGSEESWSLATYEKHDGYSAWRRILAGQMTREEVIEEVKASGLRGRGGAGFRDCAAGVPGNCQAKPRLPG